MYSCIHSSDKFSNPDNDKIFRKISSNNQKDNFTNIWNILTESSEIPFTENNKLYTVEYNSDYPDHRIEDNGKKRILFIGNQKIEEKWIKKFLIDSTRHPYTTGRQNFKLKEIQKQAIESSEKLKKWLYVAPTGSGKTEVIKKVLMNDLRKSDKPLVIIVVDTLLLRDQLLADLSLVTQGHNIISWGGSNNQASSIEDIHFLENKKTILITTAQSLILEKVNFKNNLNFLKKKLAMFYYDEAHHLLGGINRSDIFNTINQTDAFQRYFTATPTQSLLDELNGKSFFAYLDTPDNFTSKENRQVEEILIQLKLAIDEGELAPFFDFYPITTNIHDEQKIYNELKKKEIFFTTTSKGFFSVSSSEKAYKLSNLTGYPTLLGETSQEERIKILESFNKDMPQFAITCNLFNEGINIPPLNTYVDFNNLNPSESSVRLFIQRLGRTLRVYPGKNKVTIATLFDLDELKSNEWLKFFQEVEEGSFGEASYNPVLTRSISKKNNPIGSEKISTIIKILEKKPFFKNQDNKLSAFFINQILKFENVFKKDMNDLQKRKNKKQSILTKIKPYSITTRCDEFFQDYFSLKFSSTINSPNAAKFRDALQSLNPRSYRLFQLSVADYSKKGLFSNAMPVVEVFFELYKFTEKKEYTNEKEIIDFFEKHWGHVESPQY